MSVLVASPGIALKVGTAIDAVLSTLVPTTAPVCVDDNASVAAGSVGTSIDVLANDGGDSLTLQNVAISSGGGSVAIVANEIEFTAPVNAGTTVITYEATNNRGTDSGVLTVVVTEDEPDSDFGDSPATNSGPEPALLKRWS